MPRVVVEPRYRASRHRAAIISQLAVGSFRGDAPPRAPPIPPTRTFLDVWAPIGASDVPRRSWGGINGLFAHQGLTRPPGLLATAQLAARYRAAGRRSPIFGHDRPIFGAPRRSFFAARFAATPRTPRPVSFVACAGSRPRPSREPRSTCAGLPPGRTRHIRAPPRRRRLRECRAAHSRRTGPHPTVRWRRR